MRILVSAYACDPTKGSEAASGWNWTYHTAKQGHEVWCITKAAYKRNILHQLEQEPMENLHFIFINTFWWLEQLQHKYHYPVVYLHYLIWQRYAYRMAKKMHEEKPFDLVHHASYGSLHLGSHLWKLKIPFVFGPIGGAQEIPKSLRQYMTKGMVREQLRSWASRFLLSKYKNSQKAIQHAQLVLASNQETYDLVKKLGASKAQIFFDGGVADNFIPAVYPEHPVKHTMRVLWIGRFIPNKGFALVIEVFKSINKKHPITLDVIGDGPLANYYQRQVQELQLDDVITFHGRLPYFTLKQYYRNSDVFMYCGLRNNLGIQVLEAMAYGLPVVTLNLHGTKTFIPENTGFKIELTTKGQHTIEHLKQALIQLYLNPDQRKTMGQHAYQYAKTQTWSTKVKQVNEQHYQVISDNKLLML